MANDDPKKTTPPPEEPPLKDRRDSDNIQAAAFLRVNRRMSQQDIAHFLGVSPSMISRYLGIAKKYGLIKEQFDEAIVGCDAMHRLNELYATDKLSDRLTDKYTSLMQSQPDIVLKQVCVFSSGDRNTRSPEQWSKRLKIFGDQAANHVCELLSGDGVAVAGVAWGETVGRVCEALAKLKKPDTKPRLFIPTCGDPRDRMRVDVEVKSSELARKLDEYINPNRGKFHSISGVPATFPIVWKDGEVDQQATDDRREFLEEFLLCNSEGYGKIFPRDWLAADGENDSPTDDAKPLIEELDAILTSVAPPQQTDKMYTEEMLKSNIAKQDIEGYVMFDIGGVNIPINEDSAARVENEINRYWTGIRYEHYRNCAKRAFGTENPGVIVVACGQKGKYVHESIKLGLCSHAVLDAECAEELETIVNSG